MNKVRGLLLATAVVACVGNAQISAFPGQGLAKKACSWVSQKSNEVKAKFPKVDTIAVKVAPYLAFATAVKLDLARKLNALWFYTLGNASYYTPIFGKFLYGLSHIPYTCINGVTNPKMVVLATAIVSIYLAATRSKEVKNMYSSTLEKIKNAVKNPKESFKTAAKTLKGIVTSLFSKNVNTQAVAISAPVATTTTTINEGDAASVTSATDNMTPVVVTE
ncbi:MAG: hypothetical protein V1855_02210 [bacterium]